MHKSAVKRAAGPTTIGRLVVKRIRHGAAQAAVTDGDDDDERTKEGRNELDAENFLAQQPSGPRPSVRRLPKGRAK